MPICHCCIALHVVGVRTVIVGRLLSDDSTPIKNGHGGLKFGHASDGDKSADSSLLGNNGFNVFLEGSRTCEHTCAYMYIYM